MSAMRADGKRVRPEVRELRDELGLVGLIYNKVKGAFSAHIK